jgi:hypothetical protein
MLLIGTVIEAVDGQIDGFFIELNRNRITLWTLLKKVTR